MNICLLTPTFLPKLGGVEIVVSSLAERYVRAGHRVVVVTQWPRKGRGQPQDESLPYPVVRYPRPLTFWWSFGLRGITRALARAHRQLPFDVIHCHLAYPTGPVALAYGKRHRIPVVITTHGSDVRADCRYRRRASIWRKICRALREADAVTAISQEMKSLLKEICSPDGREIPIIPNAVDVADLNEPVEFDPAWPVRKDGPFVLYLGGLTHKKGVDVLLEAVKRLAAAGELPARLVIAGDGAARDKLQAQAGELNGQVQFLGRVAGPLKKFLFQNCRFVVMPSLTEGFGLVAVEALACGKPLVASAVGGLKELMTADCDLGLTVPPGDPEALAAAIKQMDTRVASFPGEAIRRYARRFDWPTVAGSYLDLYRRVQRA